MDDKEYEFDEKFDRDARHFKVRLAGCPGRNPEVIEDLLYVFGPSSQPIVVRDPLTGSEHAACHRTNTPGECELIVAVHDKFQIVIPEPHGKILSITPISVDEIKATMEVWDKERKETMSLNPIEQIMQMLGIVGYNDQEEVPSPTTKIDLAQPKKLPINLN